MDTLDLSTATTDVAGLVQAVTDEQLSAPTPCPDYTVGDLVDHIGGLTTAFTMAAHKERPDGDGAPVGDASRLEPGWRDRIAGDLGALAAAWTDPAAYEGMTQAGPIELPGEIAALVALNEVVVHGWDLAVATGQPYQPDPTAIATCASFVEQFDVDGEGPFGPPVPPPADASPLEQLVAGTGREPRWAPPA